MDGEKVRNAILRVREVPLRRRLSAAKLRARTRTDTVTQTYKREGLGIKRDRARPFPTPRACDVSRARIG